MVMEVVQEDMGGEGSMQCTSHPFKNNTPGGICAFCLQEKLGKLVSSSSPVAIFPSSSSSPSPSFRSDFGTANITTTANPSALSLSSNGRRGAKLPFLLTQRKKKKAALMAAADASNIVFKRSISTATARNASHFMDAYDSEDYNSPHRKKFWWSFLYLQKKSERASINVGNLMNNSREKKREEMAAATVVVDENESPDQARRVSRSRSVGCGSRSFSGDFFERISTGFGDCALRRVESQREGKQRIHSMHRNSIGGSSGQDCMMKERVKCGGIFSGFTITSSSSSSSSSHLVSSNEDNFNNGGVRKAATPSSHHLRNLAHPRSKSWGWALASPMRAFSKPSSGKIDASNKNSSTTAAPNLTAIPSLLAGG